MALGGQHPLFNLIAGCGAGAFYVFVDKVADKAPIRTLKIYPVVAAEANVLYGDKGVLQHFRDFFYCGPFTVFHPAKVVN